MLLELKHHKHKNTVRQRESVYVRVYGNRRTGRRGNLMAFVLHWIRIAKGSRNEQFKRINRMRN